MRGARQLPRRRASLCGARGHAERGVWRSLESAGPIPSEERGGRQSVCARSKVCQKFLVRKKCALKNL